MRLFSLLMYLAHWARAYGFWLPFLHNSLICFSKVKLLSTFNTRNFSLELHSVKEFLIIMDFKLNGDKNKWNLEGFTLKLLQRNQSKRLSIVISRSDITSKNVFPQLNNIGFLYLFYFFYPKMKSSNSMGHRDNMRWVKLRTSQSENKPYFCVASFRPSLFKRSSLEVA